MEFKKALSIFFYLKESKDYSRGTVCEENIRNTFHQFCRQAGQELNYAGLKLYGDLDTVFPALNFSGRSVKDAFKKNTLEFHILTPLDPRNHA